MGNRRNSQDVLTSIRTKLVLGALVFNPYGKGNKPGYQGIDIAQTAHAVFVRFFKGYKSPSTNHAQITLFCKQLVKLGYLKFGERVSSTYIVDGGKAVTSKPIKYMSPTFHLTESGMLYVLSTCNLEALVDIKHKLPYSYSWRSRQAGYDLMLTKNHELFLRFCCITDEQYAQGVYVNKGSKKGNKGSVHQTSIQVEA